MSDENKYSNFAHCCDTMRRIISEEEMPIVYVSKFREYGMAILDGGSSYLEIEFCPWCGQKLPMSLRDMWFDELGRLGLNPESQELPEDYHSDQWWIKLLR